MRKIIALACSLVLLFVLIPYSNAAEKEELQPQYNNISTIVVALSINKETGVAYCAGEVESYYEVPVEVLVQLQVYKNGAWKTLMSWSDTGTGYASLEQYYAIDPGYEYKVKVTGYICNDWGIPIESEVGEKIVNYPAN